MNRFLKQAYDAQGYYALGQDGQRHELKDDEPLVSSFNNVMDAKAARRDAVRQGTDMFMGQSKREGAYTLGGGAAGAALGAGAAALGGRMKKLQHLPAEGLATLGGLAGGLAGGVGGQVKAKHDNRQETEQFSNSVLEPVAAKQLATQKQYEDQMSAAGYRAMGHQLQKQASAPYDIAYNERMENSKELADLRAEEEALMRLHGDVGGSEGAGAVFGSLVGANVGLLGGAHLDARFDRSRFHTPARGRGLMAGGALGGLLSGGKIGLEVGRSLVPDGIVEDQVNNHYMPAYNRYMDAQEKQASESNAAKDTITGAGAGAAIGGLAGLVAADNVGTWTTPEFDAKYKPGRRLTGLGALAGAGLGAFAVNANSQKSVDAMGRASEFGSSRGMRPRQVGQAIRGEEVTLVPTGTPPTFSHYGQNKQASEWDYHEIGDFDEWGLSKLELEGLDAESEKFTQFKTTDPDYYKQKMMAIADERKMLHRRVYEAPDSEEMLKRHNAPDPAAPPTVGQRVNGVINRWVNKYQSKEAFMHLRGEMMKIAQAYEEDEESRINLPTALMAGVMGGTSVGAMGGAVSEMHKVRPEARAAAVEHIGDGAVSPKAIRQNHLYRDMMDAAEHKGFRKGTRNGILPGLGLGAAMYGVQEHRLNKNKEESQ